MSSEAKESAANFIPPPATVPAGAPAQPALPDAAARPAPRWWSELAPGMRALVVVASVVAAGFLLQALAPVLTPFLFGGILAYVGTPLIAWLAAHRIPRAAGALFVIVAVAAVVSGLVLVVAPLVSNEITQIAAKLPDLLTRAQNDWLPWINQQLGTNINFDAAKIKDLAQENAGAVGNLSAKLAGSMKLGGQLVLGLLVNLMLVPVVMFYLLRDWPQLVSAVDSLVPRSVRPMVRELAREIDAVLSEFLRGQASVMLALAVYYCVALKLAGLQFWLPVGLVTGLLVFVPYIGFGLGFLLGALAALTQFSTLGPIAAVAAVFGFGQILEGFVLTPRLVGERIGLHPLAVIFALMAFGQLFGFVGVLLALPASAALLVALRVLRRELLAADAPATPAPPPPNEH